jgi:hypothetical protein
MITINRLYLKTGANGFENGLDGSKVGKQGGIILGQSLVDLLQLVVNEGNSGITGGQ